MPDSSLPSGIPLPALTVARTVYVDSVTGNDITGKGTLVRPWATLERAWFERQHYGQLRAKFTVQLLGVGPYDLPSMRGSEAIDDGFFVVLGDPAAVIVVTTGTATADMAGNTLATSALAVNAYKNDWLRFTTGFYATGIFQINENAANSITFANILLRGFNFDPIVAGDAFEIIRPGTEIRVSGGFAAPPRLENLCGLTSDAADGSAVRHVFYGVRFSTATFTRIRTAGSQLAFGFCRMDNGLFAAACTIQGGQVRCEVVGIPATPAGRDLVYGAGVVITGGNVFMSSGGRLTGVVTSVLGLVFGDDGYVFFAWRGGNVTDSLFLNGLIAGADFCDYLMEGTWSLLNAGSQMIVELGFWRFAVTVGSCCVVQNHAELQVRTIQLTGGTSDPAGYAVDVRGGGRALYRGVTPAVTGGTLGSDLRTTGVAVAANAALNADGTSVAIAADALFGEVLGRLAF